MQDGVFMNSRFIRADIQSHSPSKTSNALKLLQNGISGISGISKDAIRYGENPAGNHNGIIPLPQLVPPVPLNPGVLNSWKEIATYLGRGVRTVQRWESELRLPIHRPRGKNRSAVVAFRKELDEWLHATPSQRDADDNGMRAALVEIARDLQSLALQLISAVNSQPWPDGKKLVEAASIIVQRLNILMDGNSEQGSQRANHRENFLYKSS
jgi:hypothetical protein